jgi:hypothetical protein
MLLYLITPQVTAPLITFLRASFTEEVQQKSSIAVYAIHMEVFSLSLVSSQNYYSSLHPDRNTRTLQLRTIWKINQESGQFCW